MNKILLGDCLHKLKEIPDNSVDSIVTDPPYELGFMGKSWDNTGIANNKDMWAECLRVLKPGGHLLAFSGTRTYHRMAVAIEDAGFEVRDMIEWVYGSGFPKSRNIGKDVDKIQGNQRKITGNIKAPGYAKKEVEMGKQNRSVYDFVSTKGTSEWEGWGTALKPAHEPICMARKPLAEKTVAENVLKYGTGGINIDVSRVSTDAYKDDDSNESIVPSHKLSELRGKLYTLLSSCVADKTDFPPFPNDGEYALRWKELSDFLCGCQFCYDLYDGLLPLFQEGDRVSFQQLHDVQDGISRLHKEPSNNHGVCIFRPSTEDVLSQLKSYSNDTKLDIQSQGRFPANLCHDNSEEVRDTMMQDYQDPSRFFKSIIYQAKASKSERNRGCEELEEKIQNNETTQSRTFNDRCLTCKKKFVGSDNTICHCPPELKITDKTVYTNKNNHPTVKPIALMEYLIKMVTKTGGTVLDPFAGSGSTLVAAKQNGFQYIGIEMTEEYIPIIEARLNAVDNKLF